MAKLIIEISVVDISGINVLAIGRVQNVKHAVRISGYVSR